MFAANWILLLGCILGLGLLVVIVAVVVLATAIVRFCPGYALFGISTCKDEEKK